MCWRRLEQIISHTLSRSSLSREPLSNWKIGLELLLVGWRLQDSTYHLRCCCCSCCCWNVQCTTFKVIGLVIVTECCQIAFGYSKEDEI